eukprot:Rhum_TRINITY_DN15062_c4_g4::Rhum_TRINITY_DN15062_c4_g4_i1::g.135538::m.135538
MPQPAEQGAFFHTTQSWSRGWENKQKMGAGVRGVVLEKERKGGIEAGKSLSPRLQAKRMEMVRAAGGGAAAAGAAGGGGAGDGARAAEGRGRGGGGVGRGGGVGEAEGCLG